MTDTETRSSPTRHDGVLAAIPASVAGGAVAGSVWAVPVFVGIAAGSLLAGVLMLLSLFVVPPE